MMTKGAVLCIRGGKLLWDHRVPAAFGNVLSDGALLFTSGSQLGRLDTDGHETFRVKLDDPIVTPPVVDGAGAIYAATTSRLVKIQ